MKRFPFLVRWAGGAAVAMALWAGPAWGGLQEDVNTILQDKLLRRAAVGVEVYRLKTGAADAAEILNLHAATPLMPASNLKIATTSAAMDRLGPDFRFRTMLLLHEGNLVLVGDGDPTFGDAELLKKSGWKVTTVFENWAAKLKSMNISSVKDVIIDDSIFDENFAHPGWPARQQSARFEAEVGGFNLNANCVDFTIVPTGPGKQVTYVTDPNTTYLTVRNGCVTGSANKVRLDRDPQSNEVTLAGETPARGNALVSITIHDPPIYAATVLSETLSASGIKVTGVVRRDRAIRQQQAAAAPWTAIGIHETPILAVLSRCNKDSMNLYAESLCKRLGYESTHVSGTWESGTAVVAGFLKKAGVLETEFKLDDGSGLSRGNSISPHALASVLVYDFYSKNKDMYFSSLSVAGVDGTLEDRFRERELRDLRKRVYGKSGFIEGVSTLCGYLKAGDDQWYVFSIMINGIPHLSNGEAKLLQEKIVKAVDASVQSPHAQR